jgi:hypothetical protein
MKFFFKKSILYNLTNLIFFSSLSNQIQSGVWGATLPSHATKGRFLLSKTWLAS